MKSIDVPGGVVNSLKDGLDDILGIRDSIGAALMPVYLVTRTWTGEIGDTSVADPVETKSQVLPSPRIVSMSNDSRVVEGGAVQLDDILLKMISKKTYAKNVIDGTSAQNIEKFYEIDGLLYRVINVTEKHLTWTVQIRKLSNQKRYVTP